MAFWNKLRSGGVVQTTIPLTADWRTDIQTEVTAHRTGNVVTVIGWRLGAVEGVSGDVVAYSLPPGFRPPSTFRDETRDTNGLTVKLTSQYRVIVTNPTTSVAHHSFTFVTLDPMPTGGA